MQQIFWKRSVRKGNVDNLTVAKLKTKATFIEPMLLLRTEKLPQGSDWTYEIKLDGYRALAIKSDGKVQLRSRNDNDFTIRYAPVAAALHGMPNETVLDGEVAALDEEGRPSFNLLQNYGYSKTPLVYFVFDLLVPSGRNVMTEPLSERRALLEKHVLPRLAEPIRYSQELKASLPDLIASVKSAGQEGLVAKRRDSIYEPGQRSGAWRKMRVNQGQELVIGGYTAIRTSMPWCSAITRTASSCTGRARAMALPRRRGRTLQKAEAAGNQGMPVRETFREKERALGCGPDRCEDGGMPMAEAGAGWAV